ncbi:MAG: (Fe-S)-binding protein [Chloroflexota bacterium]
MRASLCATCLVDQFYPEVGEATVQVLEAQGVEVDVPAGQTCCGQVAFNGGFRAEAAEVARHFLDVFGDAERIVVPSGSCAAMIKVYYQELFADDSDTLDRAKAVGEKTYELTDYLVNMLGVTETGSSAEGLVTYHDSCHTLRELHLKSEPRTLIEGVQGAELQEMEASDTCCGFGGLFSVKFPAISEAIMEQKLAHIAESGAGTVVATDCGCLMHLRGAMARRGLKVKALHIAQLLAGSGAEGA